MKTIPSFLSFLALTAHFAFAQGPLLPPSLTPAPTMKSLDQIEARTPIPKSPATPVAGPHFTITQPGSYYLTGNITVASGDGITITAASDVSIDLNGFTIRSALTGSFNGSAIQCSSNFNRLNVCNGFLSSGSAPPTILQGFREGVTAQGSFNYSHITNVHVDGMAAVGLNMQQRSIVENCTATNNGNVGIAVSRGLIANCIATGNYTGFLVGLSSISHCTAFDNRGDGIEADDGVVSDCLAGNNNTNPDAFVGVGIRWAGGKIHNSLSDTASPAIP